LRLAISTTAALPATTGEKFRRRYELPITQALGIIEVGLPFINVDATDHPAAVGRLLPAYRLRLVDVGFGPGVGEVLLTGPGLLDAYYQPWRTRDQIMPDGWFHTGDVGELDADGCLSLRGRTKDLISVLGMKFFPQEVESVLAQHPQVAACCVLGRADDRMGELPVRAGGAAWRPAGRRSKRRCSPIAANTLPLTRFRRRSSSSRNYGEPRAASCSRREAPAPAEVT
jgi:long-chain acyl-CoA synthetase